MLEFAIEDASAKVRTGPPIDDDEDYALPIWAGILPMKVEAAAAVTDPKLSHALPVPEHVLRYRREK